MCWPGPKPMKLARQSDTPDSDLPSSPPAQSYSHLSEIHCRWRLNYLTDIDGMGAICQALRYRMTFIDKYLPLGSLGATEESGNGQLRKWMRNIHSGKSCDECGHTHTLIHTQMYTHTDAHTDTHIYRYTDTDNTQIHSYRCTHTDT